MFGRRRAGGAGRRPMFALHDASLVQMRPTLDRRIAKAEVPVLDAVRDRLS